MLEFFTLLPRPLRIFIALILGIIMAFMMITVAATALNGRQWVFDHLTAMFR